METRLAATAFDRWKHLIAAAADYDALHRLMVEYLAEWSKRDLALLPEELANPVLHGMEEIVERALVATHAELQRSDDGEASRLLREMALTFSAAAVRLRRLQASRKGSALLKTLEPAARGAARGAKQAS